MRQVPAVAMVLFVSFTSLLLAQSTNASLTRRVTDPSRAVVAAVSTSTDFRYQSITNALGESYLPNLSPGSYRLEVEKSGFKKLVRSDVVLRVHDRLEINFAMTLGTPSETITAGRNSGR